MKSYLIKDTTKEEREEIVRKSLEFADIGCDDAVNGYDFYLPYIDGELELRELNMRYSPSYVKENPDPEQSMSCAMW